MAIDAGVPVAVPPPVTTTTSACQPPSTRGTYTGGSTLGTDIAKTATADAGTAQGSTTPPSPIVPTGNGPGTGQTAAATTGGGGCSVGGEASDAGWVLSVLGLLGLALARRRRV
jgi:MYXO-CTERM domain-containing protein